MITDSSTLWVCVDCLLAAEGDGSPEPPDREPWSLLAQPAIVFYGMPRSEHWDLERCFDDQYGGCACEVQAFSTAACDGCGSNLAGERQAYTLIGES